MNTENMMESEIVGTFDNEKINVLMRVGRIEMNLFNMNKLRYVHANNPKLINTLAWS